MLNCAFPALRFAAELLPADSPGAARSADDAEEEDDDSDVLDLLKELPSDWSSESDVDDEDSHDSMEELSEDVTRARREEAGEIQNESIPMSRASAEEKRPPRSPPAGVNHDEEIGATSAHSAEQDSADAIDIEDSPPTLLSTTPTLQGLFAAIPQEYVAKNCVFDRED